MMKKLLYILFSLVLIASSCDKCDEPEPTGGRTEQPGGGDGEDNGGNVNEKYLTGNFSFGMLQGAYYLVVTQGEERKHIPTIEVKKLNTNYSYILYKEGNEHLFSLCRITTDNTYPRTFNGHIEFVDGKTIISDIKNMRNNESLYVDSNGNYKVVR